MSKEQNKFPMKDINDCKFEKKSIENKNLGVTNNTLSETIEEMPLTGFDISLKNLHLEYKDFTDNSVKATIQNVLMLGQLVILLILVRNIRSLGNVLALKK